MKLVLVSIGFRGRVVSVFVKTKDGRINEYVIQSILDALKVQRGQTYTIS